MDHLALVDAFFGARIHPYVLAFCIIKELLVERGSSDVSGFSCNADLLVFSEASRAELDRRVGIDNLRVKVRNYERSVRSNLKGYELYVQRIFCRHPGAKVWGVDIKYGFDFHEGCFGVGDLAQVRKDLKCFLHDMGKFFGGAEIFGYVWKIEFGLFERYYSKLYIFFDEKVSNRMECFMEEQQIKLVGEQGSAFLEWWDVRECNILEDESEQGTECRVQEEIRLMIKSDTLLRVDVGGRSRSVGRGVLGA